jgi:hypothetical protein
VDVTGPDPRGEARLAADHTDLLLLTAGHVDDVVAVGSRALAVAEAWDLDTYTVRLVRINMARAMLRAGQVSRAARFLEPLTSGNPTMDKWLLHTERARLDMLQGHDEAALALAGVLRTMPARWLSERIELTECLADVWAWTGRPQSVLELVVPLVEETAGTEASSDLGPVLALAARAAGDLASGAALHLLTDLHRSCLVDPFATRPVPADGNAWTATWGAENSRLGHRQTVEPWVAAAVEWDLVRRPHDAAYCRWRAARVAHGEGQRTLAMKLLRGGARGAREHVPLSRAIQVTASRTP